jgi:hypothetical protein
MPSTQNGELCRVSLRDIEKQKIAAQIEKERSQYIIIQENKKRVEQANFEKEFPFYMVIKCGVGRDKVYLVACLSDGSIELRNGDSYGLYNGHIINYNQVPHAVFTMDESYVVDLRKNYDFLVVNGDSGIFILDLKIYSRNNKYIIFNKQVARYGRIRYSN